ncbi:MAG TPA: hypothetical protein VKV32_13365 [Stellaceae bacterium]|nr:hypothetical protein [Stellaceae bacterium]
MAGLASADFSAGSYAFALAELAVALALGLVERRTCLTFADLPAGAHALDASLRLFGLLWVVHKTLPCHRQENSAAPVKVARRWGSAARHRG